MCTIPCVTANSVLQHKSLENLPLLDVPCTLSSLFGVSGIHLIISEACDATTLVADRNRIYWNYIVPVKISLSYTVHYTGGDRHRPSGRSQISATFLPSDLAKSWYVSSVRCSIPFTSHFSNIFLLQVKTREKLCNISKHLCCIKSYVYAAKKKRRFQHVERTCNIEDSIIGNLFFEAMAFAATNMARWSP
jgi:hypothetical protein